MFAEEIIQESQLETNYTQELTPEPVAEPMAKPVAESEQQPIRTSDKEENFKNLRERTLKAEKERDELLQYIQSLNQNQEKKAEAPSDDDDFHINPEDLAEGKHLLKITKKIKLLEEKLAESENKNAQSASEIKLARDFPDYDKVVTQENLQELRKQQPILADAILETKDMYKQHALAYQMCKQLGIYQEDKYVQERSKARENHAKPRPISSINAQEGDGPLSKANSFANGLTDELKQQLLKEMQEARKRM